MKTMTNQKTITEQLKAAINGADISRYRIAKETGLTEAGLSRFVNGLQGLSLESVDKLAVCLGLELTTQRTPRKGK